MVAKDGAKAQLDKKIIKKNNKKKLKRCEKDYRAYNLFEGVKSDHRVASAKIRLTLRPKNNESSRNSLYDWSSLKVNLHIAKSFTLQLKNRFNVLQQDETGNPPNSTYNNFVLFSKNPATESVSTPNEEVQETSILREWGGYQVKKKTSQKNQNQLQSASKISILQKTTFISHLNRNRKSIFKIKLTKLPMQQQIKRHHKHGKL